jgi:hypothetical protein
MQPAQSTLHMLRCVVALRATCLSTTCQRCTTLQHALLQLARTCSISLSALTSLQGANVYDVLLQVTCSARGHCNYATGLCQCDVGYEGSACERLACPVTGSGVTAKTCNGRGACLTMAAAAGRYNGRNLVRPYVSYTAPWDAYKIQVCAVNWFCNYQLCTCLCIRFSLQQPH